MSSKSDEDRGIGGGRGKGTRGVDSSIEAGWGSEATGTPPTTPRTLGSSCAVGGDCLTSDLSEEEGWLDSLG